MTRSLRLLLLGLSTWIILLPSAGWGAEPTVVTLWPLLDYRHAEDRGYTNINLFGPLLKFERTPKEIRFGLRPLLFQTAARDDSRYSGELLYPVATWDGDDSSSRAEVIHWLNWGSYPHDTEREHSFTLFPFVFYQTSQNGRGSQALFPLAGRLEGVLGRKEIRFFLFPLYSRTLRHETKTTNILWPIFARVQGPGGESGWKFWPLAGWADKPGDYRKRFFLWPFWTRNELELSGSNPTVQHSIFPFWSSESSPDMQRESVLWPFFNHTDDSRLDYEQWEFPWPLLSLTRGETIYGLRLLPLYADETRGKSRKRWLLWPGYSCETRTTPTWEYRRDRLLYFLYSDTRESDPRSVESDRRRIDFWPLFHYEYRDGVGHFSTIALMEGFFPGNERIERSWAPLWRIYQLRWDQSGNEVTSFLWNLYWKEKRPEGIVWELFPLLRYRRHGDTLLDVSVAKGLFRYRTAPEGRRLMLLFLPWGIPLGGASSSE